MDENDTDILGLVAGGVVGPGVAGLRVAPPGTVGGALLVRENCGRERTVYNMETSVGYTRDMCKGGHTHARGGSRARSRGRARRRCYWRPCAASTPSCRTCPRSRFLSEIITFTKLLVK